MTGIRGGYTAFTLEAALNHIGSKLFKCWADLNRLNPHAKLNLLAERLGVSLDYDKLPWQVLRVIFGFREPDRSWEI